MFQFNDLCFVLNWLIMIYASFSPNLRSSAEDGMIQNVGQSQYTLSIPHRVIQLSTISFWILETSKAVPTTSQQIGQFPLKGVKYRHHVHFYFYFFLIHRMLALFAFNQSEARFSELGQYSRNMLSKTFWTLNIASLQFDEYPKLRL